MKRLQWLEPAMEPVKSERLKTMTRDEVLSNYEVSNGRIVNPGKFEGEPTFAPFLWDTALDGFADADDGKTFRFICPKGDEMRMQWPELDSWLGKRRLVSLREDDQGFVHCF
jgi:hypothetical protein